MSERRKSRNFLRLKYLMDALFLPVENKEYRFECPVLDMDQQISAKISVKPEMGRLVNL